VARRTFSAASAPRSPSRPGPVEVDVDLAIRGGQSDTAPVAQIEIEDEAVVRLGDRTPRPPTRSGSRGPGVVVRLSICADTTRAPGRSPSDLEDAIAALVGCAVAPGVAPDLGGSAVGRSRCCPPSGAPRTSSRRGHSRRRVVLREGSPGMVREPSPCRRAPSPRSPGSSREARRRPCSSPGLK